jgi:hypothetical protein
VASPLTNEEFPEKTGAKRPDVEWRFGDWRRDTLDMSEINMKIYVV